MSKSTSQVGARHCFARSDGRRRDTLPAVSLQVPPVTPKVSLSPTTKEFSDLTEAEIVRSYPTGRPAFEQLFRSLK